MIEEVKELRAELDAPTLFDEEALEQAQIDILNSRPMERARSAGAEETGSRVLAGGWIMRNENAECEMRNKHPE